MDSIKQNEIYFIYSQKGGESKIERIEENNVVKDVIPIKEEKKKITFTLYIV